MTGNTLYERNKKLFNAAALVAVCAVFYLFVRDLGVIVGDDETTAMYVREMGSGYLYQIISTFPFLLRGRVLGVPTALLLGYVQCVSESIFVYRLLTFAGVLVSAFAAYRLLKRRVSREFALCFSLLFFLFAQIFYDDFCGFTSFSVCYQIMITFGILSLDYFLRWFDDGRTKNLVLCGLFYFTAASCYESFMAFCVPLFMLACLKLKEKNELSVKNLSKALYIPALFGAAFLALYLFGGKLQADAGYAYGGTMVTPGLSLNGFFSALKKLAFSSFPLSTAFFSEGEVWSRAASPSLENLLFLVFSALVAFVAVRLLLSAPELSMKKGLYLAGMSLLTALVMSCPLAITAHYINMTAAGTRMFGASYHAYFFLLAAVLLVILPLLQSSGKRKKLFAALLAVIIAAAGYVTAVSNSLSRELINRSYYAYDELVQTEYFEAIEDGSLIFVNDFRGFYGNLDYLNEIANKSTGRSYEFTDDLLDSLPKDGDAYYLERNWETGTLMMTKLDGERKSDEVCLLFSSYYPEKKLTVEYGRDFELSKSFPLDGEPHEGIKSTAITEFDSGRHYVILETDEKYDFRFVMTI